MIKVYVKTTWQGKVAVRQGFIEEALRCNEGLLIQHKNESMAIPASKLKDLLTIKSENHFQDYYGKWKPEKLYYFWWRPLSKQKAML